MAASGRESPVEGSRGQGHGRTASEAAATGGSAATSSTVPQA
eukprot:CAMPEP_0174849354 /NCGR_PEP_ID=MMETSP1114-20130205/15400_1 /TAXON_ID=312471 /ORGANISM="Neobodo designis, Strain CCAP 1951/1" /LENGTH=41 /DNA_ID= /DNA_START= /DNA_END= /DNA_ORIENTATION=